MLQDCTQPKNAFALTAKNYVFYRTASVYKLRKLPKKVNTQLDILLSVCKRFCLYKRKNGYVTTNVYNKTNVQMRLITFPDALPLR